MHMDGFSCILDILLDRRSHDDERQIIRQNDKLLVDLEVN